VKSSFYFTKGKNITVQTNITLVTIATFFRVFSTDFLLQYSFELDVPHNPKPSPHFGLISRTENINKRPDATISTINNVLICFYKLNKASLY